VAYCLAALAGVRIGDVVLDPFGGAGTLAIESAHLLYGGALIVSDVDGEAVRAAAVNSARANTVLAPYPLLSDARQLPLPDGSVSRVISNLPWGRQVQVDEGLAALYEGAMRELQRVLRPGGRAVLLTDQSDLLLQQMGPLELAFARQISLYGSYPTIHILDNAAGQEGAAFAQGTPFAAGMKRLIERDGVWQAYSPLVGKVSR
jgi:tRNA G10  N-methylase Trm11